MPSVNQSWRENRGKLFFEVVIVAILSERATDRKKQLTTAHIF
jgi:endonuclease III